MKENQLEKLTQAIERLLLKEVAPVAPVLPIAPIAPIAPVLPIVSSISDDHNLLIKLETKMDIMTKKVDELSTNTIGRIDTLETKVITNEQIIKTLSSEGQDREMRLRSIEGWVSKAVGILIAVNAIVVPVVLYLVFKNLK